MAHTAPQVALQPPVRAASTTKRVQTYLNALEHDEARKTEIEGQIHDFFVSSPWAKQM
jgi:hypothetical protein